MASDLLERVKLSMRTSHNKLDEDIQSDIDACLMDLHVTAGILESKLDPENLDTLVFNAVKLFCKSRSTVDPVKSEAYFNSYKDLKACLQVAEGYGWEKSDDE